MFMRSIMAQVLLGLTIIGFANGSVAQDDSTTLFVPIVREVIREVPRTHTIAFITSTQLTGKFGENVDGFIKADAVCDASADAAGLSGTFKAFFRTGIDPSAWGDDRGPRNFNPPNLPIKNTVGDTIAGNFDEFLNGVPGTTCDDGCIYQDCVQNALVHDQRGNELTGDVLVWIDAFTFSAIESLANSTCNGFTSQDSGQDANVWKASSRYRPIGEGENSSFIARNCDETAHLWCFEQ